MKNVFRCKLPKEKERNTELKIRGVTQNILRDNYGTQTLQKTITLSLFILPIYLSFSNYLYLSVSLWV